MANPTPEQQRAMLQAHEDVALYWYIDHKTKEIRRKPLTIIFRVLDFFWKEKHTVWQLYRWLMFRCSETDMMPLRTPMQSDNMPIKGFPMKYELLNGWTIPTKDLKHLKNGPLAAEGLQQIIVPAAVGWPHLLERIKQFAPIITSFAGLTTIVTNWSAVEKIFSYVINTF
ncbi:hypothetical protein [Desulfobacter sp. UBA2225]|uniref:hypothetical protein n=1 Tax=Desulfobacter sp. UBA2225 TaxID=1961413 RepID=UPI00257C0550|nr:hypothetical protein [Desulfobacter sp. UBA2225]